MLSRNNTRYRIQSMAPKSKLKTYTQIQEKNNIFGRKFLHEVNNSVAPEWWLASGSTNLKRLSNVGLSEYAFNLTNQNVANLVFKQNET